MLRHHWTALLTAMLLIPTVQAETINVAVAANFTNTMKALAEPFEASTGHELALSFGSSGKFYAQINNGAPFDVFLSADQQKPEALECEGRIVPGSRFTYALGALVLWSSRPELVDERGIVLGRGHFRKLALANPRLAPYGVAATEVLSNLELLEATRPKWVQGENIGQTYQFVRSGNAELGFVALSQIMSDGHIDGGSFWRIPLDLYNPIRQDAVILKRAENNAGAKALMAFLRTESAVRIMESYGYRVAAEAP